MWEKNLACANLSPREILQLSSLFAHSGPRGVHRLRVADRVLDQVLDQVQHSPEIERLPQGAVRAEAVRLLPGTFPRLWTGRDHHDRDAGGSSLRVQALQAILTSLLTDNDVDHQRA